MKLHAHRPLFLYLAMVPWVPGCVHNPSHPLPPPGPGTVAVDSAGKLTGTGWTYYPYPGSKIAKAEDAYVDGKLVYSAWFKPDGSKVAEQSWANDSGVQYYLRDDGTIKCTIPMKNGVANGTATFFKPSGEIEKQVEYKNGSPTHD